MSLVTAILLSLITDSAALDISAHNLETTRFTLGSTLGNSDPCPSNDSDGQSNDVDWPSGHLSVDLAGYISS